MSKRASRTGTFPISRDPPEGGTFPVNCTTSHLDWCFQFLGIPPKGEHALGCKGKSGFHWFPISRDPPEGGTCMRIKLLGPWIIRFQFLGIPPKGEPFWICSASFSSCCFQFLGIPPKGEQESLSNLRSTKVGAGFQFLGIPPKGELRSNLPQHTQVFHVSNF